MCFCNVLSNRISPELMKIIQEDVHWLYPYSMPYLTRNLNIYRFLYMQGSWVESITHKCWGTHYFLLKTNKIKISRWKNSIQWSTYQNAPMLIIKKFVKSFMKYIACLYQYFVNIHNVWYKCATFKSALRTWI